MFLLKNLICFSRLSKIKNSILSIIFKNYKTFLIVNVKIWKFLYLRITRNMEISLLLMWNDEISIFCMMYKMEIVKYQNFCILLYVKYGNFYILHNEWQISKYIFCIMWIMELLKKFKKIIVINIKYFWLWMSKFLYFTWVQIWNWTNIKMFIVLILAYMFIVKYWKFIYSAKSKMWKFFMMNVKYGNFHISKFLYSAVFQIYKFIGYKCQIAKFLFSVSFIIWKLSNIIKRFCIMNYVDIFTNINVNMN